MVKVEPPPTIQALIPHHNGGSTSQAPQSSGDAVALAPDGHPYAPDVLQLNNFAHSVGMRLEVDKATADRADPPEEYVYTCRLMENQDFLGPEMVLKSNFLSRDRQAWSKNLLKRYLKECVERDPAVGSPWMVKPAFSAFYDIPTDLPEEMKVKSAEARDELLTKRRGGKVSFAKHLFEVFTKLCMQPKRELSDMELMPQPSKRQRGMSSRFAD